MAHRSGTYTSGTATPAARREGLVIDGWGEGRWSDATVDVGMALVPDDDITDAALAEILDEFERSLYELGLLELIRSVHAPTNRLRSI